ncbi:hypothetical protein [Ornithinimicrobium pekingense]|nr:hypothetical protein [Ornithinimicrobium pekingense]
MTGIDERRPFLRRDGLAAGITRHRLDGPAFHRLFGTVRVSGEVELTPSLLAAGALLLLPDAAVSHHTAARMLGGIVPHTEETHLTVARPQGRRRRPGLRCHVGPAVRTRRVDGLRVTSPEQTFTDLATHLTLVDLVVLGDSLVHRDATSPDRLLEAAAGARGPGTALARGAAALVRKGVESPMETRSRLLLTFGGLPEPRVNEWVTDEHGRRRYRLDLPYPELRLAFEYDGRQHAQDAAQWGWDVGRREWLDGQGWRLIVLRASDVFTTPWATVLRARDALAQRGFDIELPRQPPREFALHFPGRPWAGSR